MKISGTAYTYGDNINTDLIIPARYLNTSDANALAAHCMEDLDASFCANIKDDAILVVGINFGCGSSREHAPLALKAAGVRLVLAKSFSRIFFRNAINIGLPILTCAAAVDAIAQGDFLYIDLNEGVLQNTTTDKRYPVPPFPPFLQNIIAAGGLMQTLLPK